MLRFISCLGFWLTVGLFVALGYAMGADCVPTSTCFVNPLAVDLPTASLNGTIDGSEEAARHQTDYLGSPLFVSNLFDLPQGTNREGAILVYGPSIILTLTDKPLDIRHQHLYTRDRNIG